MEELIRKRKYIPETEIDTQCDDDQLFELNSQSWEPGSGTHYIEDMKKATVKDSATCTEKQAEDVQDVTVVDIHGCKYFGQFVSNELLRFNITERYVVMKNIIELLKK